MSRLIRVGLLLALTGILAMQVAPAFGFTAFVAKSAPGKIKDKSISNPLFKTNAGAVECAAATSKGKFSEAKSSVSKEGEEYTGCAAFGQEAKASLGEFEFHAGGTETILNKITVEVPESGCTVKFAPEGNKELAGASFATVEMGGHKDVEIKVNSKGVTYVSSGKTCGESGKNGEYKGSFLAEAFNEAGTEQIDIEMM